MRARDLWQPAWAMSTHVHHVHHRVAQQELALTLTRPDHLDDLAARFFERFRPLAKA